MSDIRGAVRSSTPVKYGGVGQKHLGTLVLDVRSRGQISAHRGYLELNQIILTLCKDRRIAKDSLATRRFI